MSRIMQRDEESAYWRKLFYAAKESLEVWKWVEPCGEPYAGSVRPA